MKLYSCTCGLNEWVSAPCQGHLNVLSMYSQLDQRFKGGDFLVAQVEPLSFFCFVALSIYFIVFICRQRNKLSDFKMEFVRNGKEIEGSSKTAGCQ